MNKVYFKKRLQSILTDNKFDRFIGGYRSGKIDQKRLTKVAVHSSRVFKRRVERKNKYYSVVLVVDISSSMDDGYKLPLAAQSVADTYEALSANGVEVAIIGFNQGVEMVKDFDWNIKPSEVQQHILALSSVQLREYGIDARVFKASGYTNQDAVRAEHDTKDLFGDGTQEFLGVQDARFMVEDRKGQRIILVYSDGATANEHALLREVRAVEKRGILIMGVGIRSPAVRGHYKQHVIVNQLNELYPSTIGLLSKNVKRG